MSKVEAIIEQAVQAAGYVFWGCRQQSTPQGTTYQIFIEQSDAEQGIQIADCVKAHKQILSCLDVEGFNREAYRLEVSSPGMERQLFRLAQCEAYIGQSVRCRLKERIDGNRRIDGVLKAVHDAELTIEGETQSVRLPWCNVSSMQVKSEVFK